MLSKILSLFGAGKSGTSGKPARGPAVSGPPYAPYGREAPDRLYNLLFCDDPTAFAPRSNETPTYWQSVLFEEPVDPQAVMKLARDPSAEGRVRALACLGLRRNGLPVVPPKQLMGVIVEAALAGGLDVLAAYSDGAVRYIDPAGKPAVFEHMEGLQPAVGRLLMASHTITDRIGPWGRSRRPPPAQGHVRLSFLMSDGLYLGEGPLATMHRDPVAGPTFQRATELMQLVRGLATA
ncbi:MAG: hypothetical protein V4505_02735 [Pseudomonadota bacterium]